MTTPGEITLASLAGGVAIEKFDNELRLVVENILDPNTEPTADRVITLKVTIKPDKDRGWGTIKIQSMTKLAADVAYSTRAFFGTKDGRAIACEDNPNQLTIGDFIGQHGDVTNLKPDQLIRVQED